MGGIFSGSALQSSFATGMLVIGLGLVVFVVVLLAVIAFRD